MADVLQAEFLQEVIAKKLGVTAKVVNSSLGTGAGAVGYVAEVTAVDLQWDSANELLPKSVVLKVRARTQCATRPHEPAAAENEVQ